MDIYDGRTHVDLPKMLRPFGCYIAAKVVAPHAKGDIFESIEGFNLGWSPVSKAYIIQLPTGRVPTAAPQSQVKSQVNPTAYMLSESYTSNMNPLDVLHQRYGHVAHSTIAKWHPDLKRHLKSVVSVARVPLPSR